jgi:hypothetical protein
MCFCDFFPEEWWEETEMQKAVILQMAATLTQNLWS